MKHSLHMPGGGNKLALYALFAGTVGSILISATQSTMLPAAAVEIGGKDIYPLMTTLTGAISIAIMPLYGDIGAKHPAMKPRLFALSMLLGALVILSRAFVTSMWAVVLPGALYGVVSAAIYVLGYAIIRDLYDRQKASLYLGLVATVRSIGMLAGPMLCGALIDTGSWRTMNHVIWPFLLLSAGLMAAVCPVAPPRQAEDTPRPAFDLAGAVCLVAFLVCLILALSLGASFLPFGSWGSNLLLAASAAALAGLVADIRRKGAASIVPIGVVRDRNTLCFSLANLLANCSNMAFYFFIPSFALYAMGATATQAGLTTTLMSVAGVFMGPVWGRIINRSGNARQAYLAGALLRILVTLWLIFFFTSETPLWVLYAVSLLSGFYSSSVGVVFSLGPQLQIRPEIRMQSNSLIQICQNFGASIGTAIYTLMIGALGMVAGIRLAFIVALVTAAAAFLAGVPLRALPAEQADGGRK